MSHRLAPLTAAAFILLASPAACATRLAPDAEETSQILAAISAECSLGPYFLALDDSGQVVFEVPPYIRAVPPTDVMKNCAKDAVLARLNIRMSL